MKIIVKVPVEGIPLQDFERQKYYKRIEVDLSDDEIKKIGKRYFELQNTVVIPTKIE